MSPILGIWASQISGHLWAPAGAYDALATITVPSGGAASVTFAGIPTGYKHLQIRTTSADTTSTGNFNIQVGNGSVDTGANYSWHYLVGTGSGTPTAGNGTSTSNSLIGQNPVSTTNFGASIIDILDYASISKNKTFRSLSGWDGNGSGAMFIWSGAWFNTSAINVIKINAAVTFAQNSQFALYGVK